MIDEKFQDGEQADGEVQEKGDDKDACPQDREFEVPNFMVRWAMISKALDDLS